VRLAPPASRLESLRFAALQAFSDVLPAVLTSGKSGETTPILFQPQDDDFRGLFFDVGKNKVLPEKSVIRMIVNPDHTAMFVASEAFLQRESQQRSILESCVSFSSITDHSSEQAHNYIYGYAISASTL